jgi:hypothetical protein
MPTARIMKISRHTQQAIFAHHVNPATEAITSVADALACLNAQAEEASMATAASVSDRINQSFYTLKVKGVLAR